MKFWLRIKHFFLGHDGYEKKPTTLIGHDGYVSRLNMANCTCGDIKPLGTVKLSR